MSETAINNLLALCESIDRNRALVAERVQSAGLKVDPLVAESMAKYWQALERLAAE